MLARTSRPLNDAELKLVRKAPWLDFHARRLAKQDAAHGMVETLDFDVGRAWKLISCPGPPCCPNTWLIEVEPNTFVFVESWEWLREPADLQFPGAHVTIERLPLSGRVLAARATGSAVAVPETPDEMRYLWTWEAQECAVLGPSDLEPEFLRAAGLSSPVGP